MLIITLFSDYIKQFRFWPSADDKPIYNNTEGVQNNSSLLSKIILKSAPTFQLFTFNLKQKLFTKDIKNVMQ